MDQPETPTHEAERLGALHRYRVLDTPREDMWDDLVLLAAHACLAPIACLSFVGPHRQWCKACTGLEVRDVPRTGSFAVAALPRSDLFIVRDCRTDPRFAQEPFLDHDPRIRFYAGMPIRSPDGYALGVLAVLDRQPRDLSHPQGEALKAFARQIEGFLEYRRQALELRERARLAGAASGLFIICSSCKKIQDESGAWRQSDLFLRDCLHIECSHAGSARIAMTSSIRAAAPREPRELTGCGRLRKVEE